MANKAIGPNFVNEIAAAGLTGLPFAWGDNGDLSVNNSRLTDAQKVAIQAVYDAHDPTKPDPRAEAAAMLGAGVTIVSSGAAPSINGVYATSPQDEINYTGLQVAVANGVFPGWIRDKSGGKHTMTPEQCTAVTAAILQFIVSVEEAMATALAGGAWTAPSSTVAIA